MMEQAPLSLTHEMLLEPPPPPPGTPGEAQRTPLPSPGTGSRIWLVRHGRVKASTGSYGDTDVPLSAEGLRQTEQAAASLGRLPDVRGVFTSPLSRARTMGQAVAAGLDLEARERDGWKEVHRGSWQGLAIAEYRDRWHAAREAFWLDPLGWKGHGGESEQDLVDRGMPLLEEAARSVEGATAVVTAHRQIIRATVAAAIGIPPVRSFSIQIETATGILLEDTAHGWVLHRTGIFPPGDPQMTEPEAGPPEDVRVMGPGNEEEARESGE